jgi:ABC-type sugar transport system ATPase subunit
MSSASTNMATSVFVRTDDSDLPPPTEERDDPRVPVVEAVGVSKQYGHVRALESVDFALFAGEIHALVGDNGAGKSTLIKIVAGAIAPTSGEVYLDGQPVEFAGPGDALAAGIATVYQNLALVGCRSIADNLFLGREPSRYGIIRRREMHRESRELLGALRQLNVRDTHAEVEDLSGGQRQAVAIARGLRLGSRVLILDEPTAALGVRESKGVLELIGNIRDGRRSVLIVSHNLAHVFEVADRITVLRNGRRVATVAGSETTPDDVVRMITGTLLG